MKIFVVFAAAFLAVSSVPTQKHWSWFKAKHGKSYENLDEQKVRFQIFQNNVEKINGHNARYEAGHETYTMAVNKFADLTPAEFGAMFKRQSQNGPISKQHLTRHVQTLTAPDSMDWREKNAVLEVQDQGYCRSGYAFSTTGAIEGQNAIKNNQRIPLSNQQLVDCATAVNRGCYGGTIIPTIEYIMQNDLNSAEDYPYEAKDNECKAKSGSVVKVIAAAAVDPTESALKEAVGTVGPISVTMYAEPMQFYDGGIFESVNCTINDDSLLGHDLLAVGYGTENGKKYWAVKNSWGTEWGEKGFLRLARDADQCGIARKATYPILA